MSERWKLGKRRSFGMDTGMTPGIVKILADIAAHSITSAKEREEAAQKYYKALEEAREKVTPTSTSEQTPAKNP